METFGHAILTPGDVIYQELYRRIMSLELKPGQFISENSIASEFQVSRSPIRGVFQQLANRNLLEIRPQKGTFVSLLDVSYIQDTVYIRVLVESDILRQAMSAEETLFEAMEKKLEAQSRTIKEDGEVDVEDFNRLDKEFHSLCFDYLGRRQLWEILSESQIQYQRFRVLDIMSSKVCRMLLEQHECIYKSMKNKDRDVLTRILEEHLFGSVYRLKNKMLEKYPEFFIPEKDKGGKEWMY